jgi:RNA polymerase sigma-70 factor, ECF subfamily
MEAIRFLYLRYKDNIYGYVLSIVREQHEAEDCTQQVFMKLISAIHKYEPRTVPFTAWILRVARNIAIDHLRQRRAVPSEEVFEATRQTDESSRDCRWGLEVALEALPEEQRNVVVLRHLVGLSPGEIATRMGRTESSIHGLHHRGRLTLRRELADMDCAPTAKAA